MAWKHIILGILLAGTAQAETVISPKFVIDRILAEGRDARRIELEAQNALTDYYNILGRYDFGISGKATYEDSRIRYLSGGGNLRDKTTVWNLAASKRLPTGTVFGAGFTITEQDSVLRTAQNFGGRPPSVVYDLGEITVSQDLLGNFFGMAERKERQAAELGVQAADLGAVEQKEGLVLDTLKLYWNAYVAREQLKEANARREKYEELVKEIQTKTRLAFVMPGDLPKARAEYGAQVRSVKSASYEYIRNLELLLAALRMQDTNRDVRFDVSDALPPVPTMVMPEVDGLRSVRVASLGSEGADLALQAVSRTNKYPELKLVGSAAFTGLDTTGRGALSEVGTKNYPRYGIGLEMNYKLFSDAYRGNVNQARVNSDLSFNSLLKQKEDLRQQIGTAMEQVRFTYAAAVSAIEEQEQWEQAVAAQERSFRQGRVDFSQLIMDYNSYFGSRAQRIRAVGDYHIALDTYNAAVDELVKQQ